MAGLIDEDEYWYKPGVPELICLLCYEVLLALFNAGEAV
jgi:hypothetical protein